MGAYIHHCKKPVGNSGKQPILQLECDRVEYVLYCYHSSIQTVVEKEDGMVLWPKLAGVHMCQNLWTPHSSQYPVMKIAALLVGQKQLLICALFGALEFP
jgi:hypothetical protein